MEHASLNCIQCGHVWHPHYPHRKPRICPKCKSQHWEKPREPQTTPPVEIIDPPTTISSNQGDLPTTIPSDQGIPNDELIEEIKDLRKQIELLKKKMEEIEKLCNSGLYIKTL